MSERTYTRVFAAMAPGVSAVLALPELSDVTLASVTLSVECATAPASGAVTLGSLRYKGEGYMVVAADGCRVGFAVITQGKADGFGGAEVTSTTPVVSSMVLKSTLDVTATVAVTVVSRIERVSL